MEEISFVTGAGGHLGNNLVRALARKGQAVTAGIRNPAHAARFAETGCRVCVADLLDRAALARAFQGAHTLYLAGAVFRHWAKDPERDIYRANLEATRNAIEAAAAAGVARVVYVSSLGALDRSRTPIAPTSWNPNRDNVYFRSKTDAEKLAWDLAAKLRLPMVSVLPGAFVGAHCFALTPTMGLLRTILDRKLPADPGFYFNFVDVADVAEGCWLAATRGRPGERYLLANETPTGVGEVVGIAQEMFPERGIKTPARPPRALLRVLVPLMERIARLRGVEPELQSNFLTEFTAREVCDISKSRRELGFAPAPPRQVLGAALAGLAAAVS